jgi:Zn-dependent M28 family amino/carboxypeptidase
MLNPQLQTHSEPSIWGMSVDRPAKEDLMQDRHIGHQAGRSPDAQAPLDNRQSERLKRDVGHLATEIGPRNIHHYEALQKAAAHIETSLTEAGYSPVLQSYETRGKAFVNISAERPGQECKDEIVIVGAHYDTHKDSPGANDNGTAVAALLALARHFAHRETARTLRFVAFTNEESPFTRRKDMGSRVYARACRERKDNIVGMICLETIGCYSEEVGSQWLSLGGLFLPQRGNFLALVANRFSKALLTQVSETLRRETSLRIRPLKLPSHIPGAWSSDHWSFWREGFPALMVTDTAPLRYRYYHTREDTPDKVDFEWLNHVVDGLKPVVANLTVPGSEHRG